MKGGLRDGKIQITSAVSRDVWIWQNELYNTKMTRFLPHSGAIDNHAHKS